MQNDDLASPHKPLKVVAAIPALGRFPLLKLTIERLYKKNGAFKVIVVGDEREVKKICEETGAVFVNHPNKPLGAKWNAAFKKAKDFTPDAVLFVGSSDWLSDNWLQQTGPYMGDVDMIGKPDCYFLDIGPAEMRACHWPGYTRTERLGESIGIGRLLSKRILDAMNWEPFDPTKDNSMDNSMQKKVLQCGGKIKLLETDLIKALSISTHQWENKHKFEDHWMGRLPSQKIFTVQEFLNREFPEALTLFK